MLDIIAAVQVVIIMAVLAVCIGAVWILLADWINKF